MQGTGWAFARALKMAALKVPQRTSDFATRQHAETLESQKDFRQVLRTYWLAPRESHGFGNLGSDASILVICSMAVNWSLRRVYQATENLYPARMLDRLSPGIILWESPERHLSWLLQGLALNVTHKPLQRLFEGGLGNSITIGGHRG